MKFGVIFTFLLLLSPSIYADIVMGVVPQQSPLKLLKVWSPIANYLTKTTGYKIKFKTEKSIPEFEKVLYSGGYDFAYMNPYHYILAHKKQGYVAEVRANKNINGILVMKKDAKTKKIDFKNKKYIFPAPNAFAATLVTKYELIKDFGVDIKDLNKAMYVNSHDSVYKSISKGFGDIGGGIERTFNNMKDPMVKNNIYVVHKTQAYPSHPFAFKPTLNKDIKQKIISAMLNMPDDLLKALSIKKLIKINNSEYKSVKDLSIKLELIKN